MASKYVISAAHCFQTFNQDTGLITGLPKDASKVQGWIGDHNLETSGGTTVTEKKIDIVKLTLNYKTAVGHVLLEMAGLMLLRKLKNKSFDPVAHKHILFYEIHIISTIACVWSMLNSS